MKNLLRIFSIIVFIKLSVSEQQQSLPDGIIKVHITTWNVNSQHPPDENDLAELLGVNDDNNLPDLIAVGLQEVTMRIDTAAAMEIFDDDEWTTKMEQLLNIKGYIKVHSTQRMIGLVLSVYTLLKHEPFISRISHEKIRTGFWGLWGNKGAVTLHMSMYDVSICFVNSHLAAHDEKFNDRIEHFHMIEKRLSKNCNQNSDSYTFWFGDLNFRLNNEHWNPNRIQHMIQKGELENLQAIDQLNDARKRHLAFTGFQEQPITFRPTYKYNLKDNHYNLKRRPAWTDRILYTSSDMAKYPINPLIYRSIDTYTQSDHRPVIAEFTMRVTEI